jgi:hypothetical protein
MHRAWRRRQRPATVSSVLQVLVVAQVLKLSAGPGVPGRRRSARRIAATTAGLRGRQLDREG